MAYQPKSYRKFLATSVAAAMVATAVAPVAMAAEAKEVSFKDFNDNSRGAVEVFGLVNAGFIQGDTEGNFNPDASLKRGDAAVIIARTLGLIDLEGNVLEGVDTDADAFTDVAEGSRYYTALAALRAADIIGGKADGSFAPNDTITRGEMAIIVAKAFKLEATTDSNPFTDLGKSNADAVQALYDNAITGGMTATTFGANENMKRRDFSIFTYKSAVYAGIIKDEVVAPVTELAVESVSAINAMQIQVTFNNPVDKATATDVENYKLQDTQLQKFTNALTDSASLSEDGKVVTLTLSRTGALVNNQAYSVEVSGVKDADGVKLETAYKTSFVQLDTTKASVTEVEAKSGLTGTKSVTVKFSEPLKTAGTYTIDGVPAVVTPLSTTNFANNTEVKLTTSQTLEAGKTYSLRAASATDHADNILVSESVQFTVVSDTAVGNLVSFEAMGEDKVKLTFDKEINVNTIPANTSSTNFSVDKVGGNFGTSTAAIHATDKKSVVVTIGTPGYSTTVNSIEPIISIKGLKDIYGNDINPVENVRVVLEKDVVKPTFVNATVSADNKFVLVEMSEAVLASSVANADAAALTVVNADGVDVTSTLFTGNAAFDRAISATSTGATSTATSSKYIKFYNSGDVTLKEGTYRIQLAAGAFTDTALAANTSEALDFNVTVSSLSNSVRPTVPATAITASLNNTTLTQSFTINYGTAMNSSALNVANYSIDGAGLPTGTTIVFTSVAMNEVRVTLPAGAVSQTKASDLAVFNVQNSAGLAMLAPALRTLNVYDSVAPTVESAKAQADGTLLVTFNENISLNTQTGFEVVAADGTVLSTSTASAHPVTGKQIVVTLNNGLAGFNLSTAKLKITADTVRDASSIGNALTNNVTIEDKYVTVPTFAVAQASVNGNASDIQVTFSNISDLVSEGVASFDVYMYAASGAVTSANVGGYSVAENISIGRVNATTGVVKLSASTTLDSKLGTAISLADGAQPYFTVVAKDANGNVAYSSQAQLAAALDYTAPTLTAINTNASTTGFDFNGLMYQAGTALTNGQNLASLLSISSTRTISSATYATTGDLINITLSGAASTGDTITLASGLTDAVGNGVGTKTLVFNGTNWVLQ